MATQRILDFLATRRPYGPCLVVDLDVVEDNFRAFEAALPDSKIYYAVKANPAPEILRLLATLGSSFDTASVAEIEMALDAGATPDRISFGNTIKKERDIARAYELGIRLFAVDCVEEVDKIVRAAPGSKVFCRVLTDGAGAEWPLSQQIRLRAGDGRRRAAPCEKLRAGGLRRLLPCRLAADRPRRLGPGACRRARRLFDARRGGHRSEDGQHGRRLPDPLPEGRAGGARLRPGDLRRASGSISATASPRRSSSPAAAWSAMPASSSRRSC